MAEETRPGIDFVPLLPFALNRREPTYAGVERAPHANFFPKKPPISSRTGPEAAWLTQSRQPQVSISPTVGHGRCPQFWTTLPFGRE